MPRAVTSTSSSSLPQVSQRLTKGGSLEKKPSPLAPWQSETVDYVSGVVQLFGLPPSVGAIYGVLFASPEPLCLDEITTLLSISKGSASQGLRQLKEVGAVAPVRLQEARREYFKPELSLKKLVSGFLRDRVRPSLDSSQTRLEVIERLSRDESARKEFVLSRVNTLRVWSERGRDVLPLIDLLLSEKTGS